MSDKKKNIIIALMGILILVLVGVIVFLAISSKRVDTVQIEPTPYQQQQSPTPVNQIPTQQSEKTQESELDYSFLRLENEVENKIYSPLSIKYALKMLEEGANGNTKQQIQDLTKKLNLTKYNDIDNVLSLANCVYIRDKYKDSVKESFISTLEKKYNAETKYDSFETARNINNWIEDKTLGIIKNMLSDEIVQDPNTEMILINALAIDMKWNMGFFGENTQEKDFTLANGSKSKVSMMMKETSSSDVSYYKNKKITALTMDLEKYDDTQLEFIAIMPNNNLQDYANSFTSDELDKISKNLISASDKKDGVRIFIPRFSFEYDLELKKDLQRLGVKDAFTMAADFTNMTNDAAELYVSEALHKAHIDFTEKGIKAAAVTAMVVSAKGVITTEEKNPEEVKIDKPFLFVIRDKANGEIWFVGTVYEPELWANAPKGEY